MHHSLENNFELISSRQFCISHSKRVLFISIFLIFKKNAV